MKNLCVVAVLAAALAGGALGSASAQSASKTGIKNVVLVHGAFADGSGWEAVAKILENDGYTVSVAQPPETSYAEDVKYAKSAAKCACSIHQLPLLSGLNALEACGTACSIDAQLSPSSSAKAAM